MCHTDSVVASSSLFKMWQVWAFSMTTIFVTEFTEFSEKHLGKTPLLWSLWKKVKSLRVDDLIADFILGNEKEKKSF